MPCTEELEALACAFAERMRDPAHKFIVAIGRRGVDAAADVLALARLIHAPVVTMLDAKGSVPESDPICVGCVSALRGLARAFLSLFSSAPGAPRSRAPAPPALKPAVNLNGPAHPPQS